MRRRTPEQHYYFRIRKQQQHLEEFAAHEIEWANDLLLWYKLKKLAIPDVEYRGCAYFQNKEFLKKPGSLTLLYKVYIRCDKELPEGTKENSFDLLRFRYRMYAITLEKGGY
jgi:hypothetical protein